MTTRRSRLAVSSLEEAGKINRIVSLRFQPTALKSPDQKFCLATARIEGLRELSNRIVLSTWNIGLSKSMLQEYLEDHVIV